MATTTNRLALLLGCSQLLPFLIATDGATTIENYDATPCSGDADTCHENKEAADADDDTSSLLSLRSKSASTRSAADAQMVSSAQGAASTTSGSVPLGLLLETAGTAYLTVKIAPPGFEPQTMMLDSGSGNLAFCDQNMSQPLSKYRLDSLECAEYGGMIPDHGWWGYYYEGPLEVEGKTVLDKALYNIMEQRVDDWCQCQHGMQGIFGIFYWDDIRQPEPVPDWSNGLAACPPTTTRKESPMMTYLAGDTQTHIVGIQWSGLVGPQTGTLFAGKTAIENNYYTEGPVQKAKLDWFEKDRVYAVSVQSFQWNGLSIPSPIDCSDPDSTCVLDTGTPTFALPTEMLGICERIFNGTADPAFKTSPLFVEFESPDGPSAAPTKIEINMELLCLSGYYEEAEPGLLLLGLPLWAQYYTAFDLDSYEVHFVKHSETELQTALDNVGQFRAGMVKQKLQDALVSFLVALMGDGKGTAEMAQLLGLLNDKMKPSEINAIEREWATADKQGMETLFLNIVRSAPEVVEVLGAALDQFSKQYGTVTTLVHQLLEVTKPKPPN